MGKKKERYEPPRVEKIEEDEMAPLTAKTCDDDCGYLADCSIPAQCGKRGSLPSCSSVSGRIRILGRR